MSENRFGNKEYFPKTAGITLTSDNSEFNTENLGISSPKEKEKDLLAVYIREVNRYPLLSQEEERVLTVLFQETGDSKIRERLINSNLRLVIKIAFDYKGLWQRNMLDLIQEGNFGLIRALKKFDPYRGIKLSYYSSMWIKAFILKFIMDNWNLVKIGTTQAQRKLFYNLKREKEKLRAEGFEPDDKLIANTLGVKEEEVAEMEQRLSWDLSLNAPLKDNSENSHLDFVESIDQDVITAISDAEEERIFQKHLSSFKSTINERELKILELRILAEKPLTLEKIGEQHGVSRERVRQIEERLIRKLTKFINNEIAKEKVWINPKDPLFNTANAPNDSEKGEKNMKIQSLGVLLKNYALAERLQKKGIQTVEDLTQITSHDLIAFFPGEKGHEYQPIRTVAKKLLENELSLADGKEITKCLVDYKPQTWTYIAGLSPATLDHPGKPPSLEEKLPEAPPATSGESVSPKPAPVEPAVPLAETKSSKDDSKSGFFQDTLTIIGKSLDCLQKQIALNSFSATIENERKKYMVTINESEKNNT